MSESRNPPARRPLAVYYDGACPLCRREIAAYRRAEGAERLDWIDVATAPRARLGGDLDRERALARMHVRDESGRLIDGAAAFAALWSRLPRTRRLGRVAGSRAALLVLEPLYSLFLRLRPLWRRARTG